MKFPYYLLLLSFVAGCTNSNDSAKQNAGNPFLQDLNVPVDYAEISAIDIEAYASGTAKEAAQDIDVIIGQQTSSFENLFVALDDVNNKISTASNNCYMFFWVSPDSLSRVKGFAGYEALDSTLTSIYSNKALYNKMIGFTSSEQYKLLKGSKKLLVDDLVLKATRSGVNMDEERLSKFKQLNKEINKLSSRFSENMNTANDVLMLDEKTAAGLPENFKQRFKTADNEFKIPVINANLETVMSNADLEETRKAWYFKYYNRAANKNLEVLDSLVLKRHQLASTLNYGSYAAYTLVPRMAKDPATVWAFINDLAIRSKAKALKDIELLKNAKKEANGNATNTELYAWDLGYYTNQLLKTQYKFDAEKMRDYLPMQECLKGMFNIYQDLLGLQFKKIENPSIWHEEVELYEVYEGDKLKGRFYLDLFPRPNKESWFYGVTLSTGKATPKGYEVPVCMLLGNFTRPTKDLPSLLSFNELNTLFHEFGHIMNSMAYHGDYSSQSNSKDDFTEAMSQLFENWLLDYPTVSSFAKHYKTGEVLPRDLFENMIKAKNITSGLGASRSLAQCMYDMNLYDRYDPSAPLSTDKLWQKIDQEMGVMPIYVQGTHRQASWIHINTNPVYYYGYLWSEVYAQDMFTVFKKNGLTDKSTGIRYRELILANGTQRDIVEAVEEFLGRRSNNEAYIKSLGLD